MAWPARLVAGLTEAFGPGFDPSLPRSDQALDARVTNICFFVFSILLLIRLLQTQVFQLTS